MKTKHLHDKLGIWSSILCIIHCLIVPLVAMIGKGYDLHHNPYWDFLQIVFVLIGFWAIKHATSHSPFLWLKAAFWLTFGALVWSLFIHHSTLGHVLNYGGATGIILLHLVNMYYAKKEKSFLGAATVA